MDAEMDDEQQAESGKWKWWALLAIIVTLLIVIGIAYGLYQLGGADQAPLERLRDIAVIFLIFQLLLVTIVLGGIAAGLVFLIMVLKDQIIPLLSELTETARRLRGTTEFMTEEAVKPIIKSAGQAAKLRAMMRTVTGADRKRR
jgi:flagellar basal body-associated protein FliL